MWGFCHQECLVTELQVKWIIDTFHPGICLGEIIPTQFRTFIFYMGKQWEWNLDFFWQRRTRVWNSPGKITWTHELRRSSLLCYPWLSQWSFQSQIFRGRVPKKWNTPSKARQENQLQHTHLCKSPHPASCVRYQRLEEERDHKFWKELLGLVDPSNLFSVNTSKNSFNFTFSYSFIGFTAIHPPKMWPNTHIQIRNSCDTGKVATTNQWWIAYPPRHLRVFLGLNYALCPDAREKF